MFKNSKLRRLRPAFNNVYRSLKMRIKGTRRNVALILNLLIFVNGSSVLVNGQSPSDSTRKPNPASVNQRATINDEMVKAYDAALVELDHLRRVNKLKDAELDAYKKQLEAQESYARTLELIVEKQRKIVTEGEAVQRVDEKVFNEFKSTVVDLRAEVDRLRKSRDRYRGLVKYAAGIALLIGLGLGYVLGTK